MFPPGHTHTLSVSRTLTLSRIVARARTLTTVSYSLPDLVSLCWCLSVSLSSCMHTLTMFVRVSIYTLTRGYFTYFPSDTADVPDALGYQTTGETSFTITGHHHPWSDSATIVNTVLSGMILCLETQVRPSIEKSCSKGTANLHTIEHTQGCTCEGVLGCVRA